MEGLGFREADLHLRYRHDSGNHVSNLCMKEAVRYIHVSCHKLVETEKDRLGLVEYSLRSFVVMCFGKLKVKPPTEP